MRRAQVFYNRKTGTLSVQEGWPPTPKRGDMWSKQGSKKAMNRRVIRVEKCRVYYVNEDLVHRDCSVEAFKRWCDCSVARLLKRAGKKVAYK